MSSSYVPLSIAQEILQLATRLTAGDKDKDDPSMDSLSAYEAKFHMHELCTKLLQAVNGPEMYTILLAESCHESSALGFINSLSVPDVIGDGSISLLELSEKTETDAKFLAVAMGCLLKHGYFNEVGGFGSQVYANNEMSETLREGNSLGVKDAVGFICDEAFKATSYLSEASKITEGKTRLPGLNIAFGFHKSPFEWMSDNAWRGERMGKAMQQLHRTTNGNVASDYPWNKLVSPVVDVGGGIGSLEMMLLKDEKNASLRFVIFDIPETIENAKKVWSAQPARSQIAFIAGNFMPSLQDETNLPLGLPTYVIRHVLHDWMDDEVVAILRNIRTAMTAVTNPPFTQKLLVCEMLFRASSPRFVHTTSIQLLALNNGLVRTEANMVALIKKAGFSVTGVHHMRAVDSVIEAVPAL